MTTSSQSSSHHRPVRSFVLRDARLTAGQTRAMNTLWPQYGIDIDAATSLPSAAGFAHEAPIILEIGFGNGDCLLTLAQQQPEHNFIGVEVHRPGVGHALLGVERAGLSNVRLVCTDVVALLNNHCEDRCLAAVHIFFPDPWPKRRHHKRRLIQPLFVSLLARKLKAGGLLHIATDWEHYARHILATLHQSTEFTNTVQDYAPRPASRPHTKFEQRGIRKGHQVWDIVFRR